MFKVFVYDVQNRLLLRSCTIVHCTDLVYFCVIFAFYQYGQKNSCLLKTANHNNLVVGE